MTHNCWSLPSASFGAAYGSQVFFSKVPSAGEIGESVEQESAVHGATAIDAGRGASKREFEKAKLRRPTGPERPTSEVSG